MCEFTACYTCKNVEMNLKSTTANGLNFWIINSLMEFWGVCLTWLDCKNTVHAKLKCRLYCQCMILSYFLFALMLFYVAGVEKHITNFDSPWNLWHDLKMGIFWEKTTRSSPWIMKHPLHSSVLRCSNVRRPEHDRASE